MPGAKAGAAISDRCPACPSRSRPILTVEDQANSNGVTALKANIAPGDSPVSANLKKAGAIIIGLTNTPEFSLRTFTENPLHGLARNPWNPAVTCGGSSDGIELFQDRYRTDSFVKADHAAAIFGKRYSHFLCLPLTSLSAQL